jgi:hypothetical protein
MKNQYIEYLHSLILVEETGNYKIFRYGVEITVEELFDEKLWNTFETIDDLKLDIQNYINKRIK